MRTSHRVLLVVSLVALACILSMGVAVVAQRGGPQRPAVKSSAFGSTSSLGVPPGKRAPPESSSSTAAATPRATGETKGSRAPAAVAPRGEDDAPAADSPPSSAAERGGGDGLCRSRFKGFPETVNLDKIRQRYAEAPLDAELVRQLVAYKKRVADKLRLKQTSGGGVKSTNALWEPIRAARVDWGYCFAVFPECAVFNRTEVQLPGNRADVDSFMMRKCCVEHSQMLRALRSLTVALRAEGAKLPRPPAGASSEVVAAAVPHAWVTAGTLLGATREGGVFIPWDTDVDVLISPQHEKLVLALLRAHSKPRASARAPKIVVAERDDEEDDPLRFAAMVVDEPKDHAHGKMIGVVYGTPDTRHEEASRVEIWVAQESRKMQRADVNLPLQPCRVYDVAAWCPAKPVEVLERGYGPFWCVACKAKSQNCKEANAARHSDSGRLSPV